MLLRKATKSFYYVEASLLEKITKAYNFQFVKLFKKYLKDI